MRSRITNHESRIANHKSRITTIALTLILAFPAVTRAAQPDASPRLSLLDVPFLSQPEALCGGAAAAMVLRYWGERGINPEDFAALIDRRAGGIRTDALTRALVERGWEAIGVAGAPELVRRQLGLGRPVIALIEDRPKTFHYVVIVGWDARAVVLHDPARAPYQVVTADQFERRWLPAHRWMLVLARVAGAEPAATPQPSPRLAAPSPCDALVAEGIRLAQANNLPAAERALAEAAHSCPGPAPVRELAGVRLLQRRWSEVRDLASQAVAQDPTDRHAWQLLGTSRFIEHDERGALEAFNRADEPVVDLLAIDGLVRTRHRVAERLLGIVPGEVLTTETLARAERRLDELPSAFATRVRYALAGRARAEVRATVAERPAVPRGALAFAAIGLEAAASQQVRASVSSLTGGGERITAAWRFWPHRPRYAITIAAPAPWRGVWEAEGFMERQPFTSQAAAADRAGARLGVGDWATGSFHWNARTGVDRWRSDRAFFVTGAGLRWQPRSALRVDATLDGWAGRRGFAVGRISPSWRSSQDTAGTVLAIAGTMDAVSALTPLDLWPAGDTGHARNTWLRAHPVLDDGALRVERLGRRAGGLSIELQRWRGAGPVRIATAAFTDVLRTAGRLKGESLTDADVGIGLRILLPAGAGLLRADVAHGLRDGANAVSLAWNSSR
jgi:predicted double-glycine peptidase